MKLCKDTGAIYFLGDNHVWLIPPKKLYYLILLLFITHTSVVNAVLTATTANTIQGTAPYLTFDDTTKVTNTDELLGITLSDGTSFTKLTNTSTASSPIELPVAGETLGDIKTLIPATLTSVNLSALISAPYNQWGDDDGDGQGVGEVSATGTLSVSLKDVNDNTVSLTDTLSGCNAPYSLTLTSTAGTLSTQYGDPSSTDFTASNTTYYIKPKTNAYVCYAKPNLVQSFDKRPEWDGVNGFKLQDKDTPSSNFPRTGFNGAFFDMTVAGETAANVIAANESSVGSGEVNATSGATNIKLELSVSPSGANVVRVTLSGPSSGQTSGQPDPAAVTMPTEFTLYSDGDKTNKIYSFALSKWFIPKSGSHAYDGTDYPDGQTVPQYCASLAGSYRVPSVSEYTNANGNGWTGGAGGWDGRNAYARAIGNGKQETAVGIDDGKGGLFAEWGNTTFHYYTNSDWDYIYWWAIEQNASGQYNVDYGGGSVNVDSPSSVYFVRAACVSP